MLYSKAIQTQFVIAILCPTASYSDLLQEARSHNVVILEMIPFTEAFDAYKKHLTDGTAILFIFGPGKSELVTEEDTLYVALDACRCHSTPVNTH